MADKRITELTNERLILGDDDYAMIDSNEGTYKYKLKRIVDSIPAPDTTLSIAGRAADSKAVGDEIAGVKRDLNDKANIDGTYDGMTVGSAKQLLSEKYLLDEEPYQFRASGGDGADRVEECIVGGSVAWNQMFGSQVSVLTGGSGNGLTWSYDANTGTITVDGTSTNRTAIVDFYNVSVVENHIYYMTSDPNIIIHCPRGGWNLGTAAGKSHQINKATGSAVDGRLEVMNASVSYNNLKFIPQVIDLTALFGSTIADYIYSLEQATAGAGVAWFKKYFPEDYYPYSAPTLRHVEGVSQKEVVGFNQWDEEWESGAISESTGANVADSTRLRSKNLIPVLPNAEYYVSGVRAKIYCYDINGAFLSVTPAYYGPGFTFTPDSNARFIRWQSNNLYGTTYNHDVCINLSDPTKNGQYEPYRKNIYPLDSTLTLRGVPKLTDGKMWFDGDKYNADGSVTRNTILRAYQSGDESLVNAITDGTNTVVYSANASTEEATPYTALQTLDPNGTEKFVSTGIVPVGHYSKYLENLRAKIEGLPKDFSTLIAPTEKTYKATRNYTVGSLLIVDNILYKVTSAIANGGTITPNTNVTATTLAAVIAAL